MDGDAQHTQLCVCRHDFIRTGERTQRESEHIEERLAAPHTHKAGAAERVSGARVRSPVVVRVIFSASLDDSLTLRPADVCVHVRCLCCLSVCLPMCERPRL
uniref:Uncharacterized protein n=1 Tax=Vitrella brassicaformis TaxID=1169539 RepID=A0A7S1PCE4_9ALVE